MLPLSKLRETSKDVFFAPSHSVNLDIVMCEVKRGFHPVSVRVMWQNKDQQLETHTKLLDFLPSVFLTPVLLLLSISRQHIYPPVLQRLSDLGWSRQFQ